jgi:hypothetical protein
MDTGIVDIAAYSGARWLGIRLKTPSSVGGNWTSKRAGPPGSD